MNNPALCICGCGLPAATNSAYHNPTHQRRVKRAVPVPPPRYCGCGCGLPLDGANRTRRKEFLNTAHRVRAHRAVHRNDRKQPAAVH